MRSIMLMAWLVLGIVAFMATAADATVIRAASGATASVSPAFAEKARCVVGGLEAAGVRVKFMGGYGKRSFRHSKHPAGLAIDINQYRRDVTRPGIPRALGIQVAQHCGVISGAQWRHADNGHFEDNGTGHKWPRYAGVQVRDRNGVW